MNYLGGCYCGALRYQISGEIANRAMCFCRECQHIAGGGPNIALTVLDHHFAYTLGQPSTFARSDLEAPARREFCGNCGTHITTRSPRAPGFVIIKAGSLDEPDAYGMPAIAVHTAERQIYHCIPDGIAQFEKLPQRG